MLPDTENWRSSASQKTSRSWHSPLPDHTQQGPGPNRLSAHCLSLTSLRNRATGHQAKVIPLHLHTIPSNSKARKRCYSRWDTEEAGKRLLFMTRASHGREGWPETLIVPLLAQGGRNSPGGGSPRRHGHKASRAGQVHSKHPQLQEAGAA